MYSCDCQRERLRKLYVKEMQMFHEADSIVMQTYTEGFGLVALEAIPAGMVVFDFSGEQSEFGMSQIHQRNIDKPKVALSYHGNLFF